MTGHSHPPRRILHSLIRPNFIAIRANTVIKIANVMAGYLTLYRAVVTGDGSTIEVDYRW